MTDRGHVQRICEHTGVLRLGGAFEGRYHWSTTIVFESPTVVWLWGVALPTNRQVWRDVCAVLADAGIERFKFYRIKDGRKVLHEHATRPLPHGALGPARAHNLGPTQRITTMYTVAFGGSFKMDGPNGFSYGEKSEVEIGGLDLAQARRVEDALGAGEVVVRGELSKMLAEARAEDAPAPASK